MNIVLPQWLHDEPLLPLVDDVTAMMWTIDLVHKNIKHGTGGPFASCIVDQSDGSVLGVGVNLVTSLNCSILHAEIVAITHASDNLGTWLLGGTRGLTLYASAEPCAMCMGAIPWTGINRVVIGARDEDIRAVGFDEGIKATSWLAGYAQRGITVLQDVCRPAAIAALQAYVNSGGEVYNGHRHHENKF